MFTATPAPDPAYGPVPVPLSPTPGDGVPDGDYTLVASTNTAHAVPEDNFDDNFVCKGLRITGNNVQELATPPIHAEVNPPTVNFDNVPESETATRPVRFEVIS